MTLDEQDIRKGTKFIVGKWRPDFVVSLFSNDLAHIPAAEFKSEDGRDLTALVFEFFEDGRMTAENTAEGRREEGSWEQTGLSQYRWSVPDLLKVPEGDFKKSVETLTVQEGRLVFSLGFLAIAMEKTEEGVFTEPPDIGDMEPDEGDPIGIVGKYEPVKAMSVVGDKFGLFSREEVEAEAKKRMSTGELDEDAAADMLAAFEQKIEFTQDRRVLMWAPLPKGVTQEQIEAALEAGQIKAVRDGLFCAGEMEWKTVDGKCYYNTNEHRELFGEEQSPWDELKPDEEGRIPFASGMMLLKKL
jgi:hypothetical protein